MRAFLALWFGVLALVGVALAKPSDLLLLGVGSPAAGGGGAQALDCGAGGVGSCGFVNNGTGGTGGTLALSGLTTTNSSGVAFVCAVFTAPGGLAGITVTSTHLTWSFRQAIQSGNNVLLEFTAPFTSTLSSEVATFNVPGGASWTFATASDFGIANSATSSYFDTNASLPAQAAAHQVAISTSNANDAIVGCSVPQTAASEPPLSGFTQIVAANFLTSMIEIVTATQSSLNVGITDTAGTPTVADAIIK